MDQPPDRLPDSLLVATGKGGSGKTHVSANLAVRKAALGLFGRVVVVDLDPQANMGTALGVEGHDQGQSLMTTTVTQQGSPVLHDTGRPGLFYVAGGLEHLTTLANFGIMQGGGSTGFLASALRASLAGFADGDTMIYIDTAPSSGHPLSDAALQIAEALLIPTKVDDLALAGLETLIDRLVEIAESGGGVLDILGIVLFASGIGSTKIRRRVRARLEEQYKAAGVPILEAFIRHTEQAQVDSIYTRVVASEYARLAEDTDVPAWYETIGVNPDDRLSFASNAGALAADYEQVGVEVDKLWDAMKAARL